MQSDNKRNAIIDKKTQRDSENLKDDNNIKQINLVSTLSVVPLFSDRKGKKKKHMTKCGKFKHSLLMLIENVYAQILILVLAVYSLFHSDIMKICLPLSTDVPFHHITEAVFFFFTCEFTIFIIAKKNFIGSFYFYLDLVSLISLLPEVGLIWHPILALIAGSDGQDSVHQILGNSHLAKTGRASAAGSKASKYLRLLRLINFIKVIRVAKMIDATKRFTGEDSEEKTQSQINSVIVRDKRKNILANEGDGVFNNMVLLSQKYKTEIERFHKKKEIDGESDDGSSNLSNDISERSEKLEKSESDYYIDDIKNLVKFQRISVDNHCISNEMKKIALSKAESTKSVNMFKFRMENENKNQINKTKTCIDMSPSNRIDIMKNGNFRSSVESVSNVITPIPNITSPIINNSPEINIKKRGTDYLQKNNQATNERSQPLDLENTKLNNFNETKEKDKKFKSNNIPIDNGPPLNANNLIISTAEKSKEKNRHVTIALPEINTSKAEGVNKKLKMFDDIESNSPINMQRHSHLTFDAKPFVDNILNKYKSIKLSNSITNSIEMDAVSLDKEKLHDSNRNIIDINSGKENIVIEDQWKKYEERKIEIEKKREADLVNEVSQKSNSKLEKRLTKGITHQVVLLIMIILVVVPIVDIEFISGIIYSSDMTPTKNDLCIGIIFEAMSMSLDDPSDLTFLNLTISTCFYSSDYLEAASTSKNSSLIYTALPEVTRFLNIDFNQSQVFLNLQKLISTNNTNNNSSNFFLINGTELSTADYVFYLENYRDEEDYFEVVTQIDDYNNITYIYDTREYGVISSITNILKSIYVAVLLIAGTYVFSLDVNEFIITPLDKIFVKLNLNLKNLEIYDNDKEDEKGKDTEYEWFEIASLFDNFNKKDFEIKTGINGMSIQRTKIKRDKTQMKKIKKRLEIEKKLKDSLETNFIDTYISKLLKLISISIGKIPFLILPNSNLDKDLNLNLNTLSIGYEGVILNLKISNTDDLFFQYTTDAPSMISKILTVFHSLGIIFLGEPYKKQSYDAIIWKRDKNDYVNKSKKYAFELLRKKKAARTTIHQISRTKLIGRINKETNETNELLDEIYSTHYTDMSVLCGLEFIHVLLNNMKATMQKLRECNVQISLFLNHGDIMQGFIGNENLIDEAVFGTLVLDSIRIFDNLLLQDESTLYQESIEDKQSLNLPSLFIDDSVVHFLDLEVKKYIFPFEVFYDENSYARKRRVIHRHYFNYNYCMNSSNDTENDNNDIYDTFETDDFSTQKVYDRKLLFERLIIENKYSFINYFVTKESYIEIVSEIEATVRTMIVMAHNSFEILNLGKARQLLKDIKNLFKFDSLKFDPILCHNILRFDKLIEDSLNKDKETWKNYTKILK